MRNQIVVLQGLLVYLQKSLGVKFEDSLDLLVEGNRYGKLLLSRALEHKSTKIRRLYGSKQ